MQEIFIEKNSISFESDEQSPFKTDSSPSQKNCSPLQTRTLISGSISSVVSYDHKGPDGLVSISCGLVSVPCGLATVPDGLASVPVPDHLASVPDRRSSRRME